jgi:hypothetical protein
MATAEERLQILRLINEGKITAEEGARLLQALHASAARTSGSVNGGARWLRIKVTDLRTGAVKFNINLPISLVKVGMRLGAQFGTGDIAVDTVQISDAIRNGTVGKVAELVSDTENERVEIWLE